MLRLHLLLLSIVLFDNSLNGHILRACRFPRIRNAVLLNSNDDVVTLSNEDFAPPDYQLTLSCEAGFALSNIGSRTAICTSNGIWQFPDEFWRFDECQAVGTCPRFAASVANGNVIGTAVSQGSVRLVVCSTDYIIQGASTIVCQNGQWSSPGQCVRSVTAAPTTVIRNLASCPTSIFIENGFVVPGDGSTAPGSTRDVQCYQNYQIRTGPSRIVCENGQWSNAGPCLPILKSTTTIADSFGRSGLFITTDIFSTGVTEMPTEVTTTDAYPTTDTYPTTTEFETTPEGGSCFLVRPRIPNGFVLDGGVTYGSQRVIRCNEGYTLQGEGSVTCADGQWETTGRCVPVNCPLTTPEVGNGSVLDGSGNTHRSRRRVVCFAGFKLQGADHIECRRGQWSMPGVCVPAACPDEIPQILNGTVLPGGVAEATIRIVICNSGYTIDGTNSIVCNKGEWMVQGSCRLDSCFTQLPTVSNGVVQAGSFTPGSRWSIKCNEGYAIQGSDYTVCQNGQWSEFGKCIRIGECPPETPSVANGVVLDGGVSPGSTRNIKCDRGYRIQGQGLDLITCRDGQWSPPGRCLATDSSCPLTTPRLLNGFIQGGDVRAGSTRVVICNDGYKLQGFVDFIVCEDGQWSSPGLCVSTSCSQNTPEILHGSVQSGETVDGSTRAIQCDSGYILQGSEVIVCNEGQWSLPGECIPFTCKSSGPEIVNGFVHPGGETNGSRRTVTCNTGYSLEGSDYVVCINGIWSTPVSCLPVDCPSATPNVPNGFVRGGPVSGGSVRAVRCYDGYDITGADSVVCTAGQWSSPGSCILKGCPPGTPSISHGYVHDGSVSLESRRNVSCNRGYKLEGANVITCSNGQWSRPGRCVPIVCPFITPPVANGNVVAGAVAEGTLRTVRCNQGYSILGASWVACTNGRWSTPGQCIREDCPSETPAIANGIAAGEGTSPRSQRSIRCNIGFELHGASFIVCLNGEWTLPGSCHPITCPSTVPGIPHGIVQDGAVAEGSRRGITCNAGFQIEGADFINCTNGYWSRPGRCVPAACSLITPQVSHGFVSNGGTQSGSSRAIECDTGYELQGPRSIICQNGEWSEPGHCSEIAVDTCPRRMPAVPNGFVEEGGVALGSSRKITCNTGYTLQGSAYIVCNEGQWSTPGQCIQVTCTSLLLPNIANGVINSGGETHGSRRSVTCNRGYALQGSGFIICRNGEWLTTARCLPADCPSATPNVLNGFVHDGQVTAGSSRRISCNNGYTLQGAEKIVCTIGQWTNPGTCIFQGCSTTTPTVLHGMVHSGGVSSTSRRTISCDRGYQLQGPEFIICNNGQWSLPGQCVPIDCSSETPFISNGIILQGGIAEGSRRTVQCNRGYELSGTDSIICTDGQWSTPGICILLSCSVLTPSIPNGFVLDGSVANGTTRYLQCNAGFRLVGSDSIICRDGLWSNPGRCESIECPSNPPFILNGMFIGDGVLPGSQRTLQCNPGYELQGATSISCSNGQWTLPGSCILISCPTIIPDVPNGVVQSGGILLESRRTVFCNRGYRIEGPDFIICNFGRWSMPGRCVQMICSSETPAVANGFILEGPVTEGSRRSVQCNTGYRLQGPDTIVCSNGQWLSPGKCESLQCPSEAPYVSNGRFFGGDITAGSMRTLECNTGFELQGASSITCVEGQWTPPGSCIMITCSTTTPDVLNGIVHNGGVSHGTRRTVSCYRGYRMEMPDFVICNFGQWSTPGRCVQMICPSETPFVANGRFLDGDIIAGSMRTLECNSGFELAGASSITCIDGQWTFPGSCQMVTCSTTIPDVLNGIVHSGGVTHGTRRNVSCNRGYKLQGQDFINCTSGQWSTPGYCEPIVCPADTPIVTNGIVIEGGLAEGSRRKAQCNFGYSMNGADFIVCRDGQWTTPGVCTAIVCSSETPNVFNGLILDGGVFEGTRRLVQCHFGYELVGANTIDCSNGQWTSPGTCVSLGCSEILPPLYNGTIHEGGVSHESRRRLSCNRGYRLVGADFIICNSGQWSRPGYCDPIVCSSQTPNIFNGVVLDGGVTEGTSRAVQCNEGYELRGSNSIVCTGGQWSTPGSCVFLGCSTTTPTVSHGIVHSGGVSSQSRRTISCDRGYKLVGSDFIICNSGNWSTPGYCEPIVCSYQTPNILNGVVLDGGVTDGSYRNITCKNGYELHGAEVIVCIDGQWSTPGTCNLIGCSSTTPIVSHGIVHGGGVLPESRRTVSCNRGYQLQGPEFIICKNGQWSMPGQCILIVCSSLTPNVLNGFVVDGGIQEGTSRSVQCNVGYELQGSSSIVCTDGQWSTPGTCNFQGCSTTTPTVLHGMVHSGGVSFQSRRSVSCNRGYQLQGRDFIICNNGQWSTPGQCVAIVCSSQTPNVLHGFIMDGDVQEGASRSVRCNIGYELQGSNFIVCTSGQWSTPGYCEPIVCPADTPIVTNGIVVEGGVAEGSRRMVQCNFGYSLNGADFIVCSNGQWSNPGLCEPLQCSLQTPTILNGRLIGVGNIYGSQRTIQCDNGFEIDGVSSITCIDGEWTLPGRCVAIACPIETPDVLHGNIPQGEVAEGSRREVFCDNGYELDGADFIVCRGGQWSTPGLCSAIVCSSETPIIINGFVLDGGVVEGSRRFVRCNPGYEMLGANTIYCSNGQWTSPGTCILPDCSDTLPIVSNGIFHEGGVSHESRRRLSCNRGYRLVGTDFIICNSGQWSRPGYCDPIVCSSQTPNIFNGVVLDGGVTEGTSRSVQCNEGYELRGSNSIVCTNGQWSTPGSCVFLGCSTTTPSVSHGIVHSGGVSFESRRTLSCNRGYQLQGPEFTICKNGQWSMPGQCILIVCSSLTPHVLNGFVVDGGIQEGTSRSVQCNVGYELQGSSSIVCTDGQWSTPGTCIFQGCSTTTPTVLHGMVHSGGVFATSRRTVSCNRGYELQGPDFIICNNGQWSLPGQCVPIVCSSETPFISNGIILQGGIAEGSRRTVQCNRGYELSGTDSIICTDGQWSTPGICILLSCSVLTPSIPNGFVLDGSVANGTTRYLQCNTGFRLVGSDSIICRDGLWSNPGRCESIECPSDPPFVLNGEFLGNSVTLGSQRTLQCNPGYELQGATFISCSNGQWTLPGSCILISCPTITPDVPNGIVQSGGVSLESRRTILCDRGYRLEGPDFIICNNGQWSKPGFCTAIVCSTETPFLLNGIILQGDLAEGTSRSVQCNRGYRIQGANSIICTNGQWSTPGKCIVIACSEATPSVRNGVVHRGVGSLESRRTVSCNRGYRIEGQDFIICSNGRWSTPGRCVPIVCPSETPIVTNGLILDGAITEGSRRFVHCNRGYSVHGVDFIVCRNGQWSAPGRCEAHECPSETPQVSHGKVIINGSRRLLSCDTGYELRGSDVVICRNGLWSVSGQCFAASLNCSSVTPQLRHGTVFSGGREHGSRRQITCHVGYEVRGLEYIVCQNGLWTVQSQCVATVKICPSQLPPLPNGFFVQESGLSPGSRRRITCHRGYELLGSDFIVCDSEGRWSDPGQCRRRGHGTLIIGGACPLETPFVEHGFIYNGSSRAGARRVVQCNQGYALYGNSSILCNNSRWSEPGWCGSVGILQNCPEVNEQVVNGVIVGRNDDNLPGSIRKLECFPGFVVSGPDVVYCINGQWTPAGTCESS